jgi:formylglycine-generating enzyme required for sulfatase activity
MKRPLPTAALGLFAVSAAFLVTPCFSQTITNLKTSQRPDDSGLVDIRFDLAGEDAETTQSFVSISISPDGGQSYPIESPSVYFSGDVGFNVPIGTGKHVVWDAAADRPEVLWPNSRVRLVTGENDGSVTIMLPGDVPLVLVPIPAGTFVMGSPETERSRDFNEGPQTNVTISQDFYMGKYEITQAQWVAVMGSWPQVPPTSEQGLGPNHPAYFLSWNDASDFINALNNHIITTGQGPAIMRLPTAAEWEYACRAGTTTRFSFGDSLIGEFGGDECEDDDIRSEYMWFCGNNSTFGAKPVGGKLPNAFGLYDMHGNVFEWCEDYYSSDPLPGGSVTDPIVTEFSQFRVTRSGFANSRAFFCRSAASTGIRQNSRGSGNGFRLVTNSKDLLAQVDANTVVSNDFPIDTRGIRRPENAIPLTVDVPVDSSAQVGRYRDFSLEVPQGNASSYIVRVTRTGNEGVVRLLGRKSALPTLFTTAWKSVEPTAGTLEILIPTPSPGSYYFSVFFDRGVSSETEAPFQIVAVEADRYLAAVSPARGGGGGLVTVKAFGLGFEPASRWNFAELPGTLGRSHQGL